MNFQKWELFSGSPGTPEVSTIQLHNTTEIREHDEQKRMTIPWPSHEIINNKTPPGQHTQESEKMINVCSCTDVRA